MIKFVRCILIAVVATSMALSAADMVSGTWKLNLAKSKYNPGPAPKSLVVNTSMEGDWIVSKSQGVDSEGKATNLTNKYKLDGKEYPYKTATVDGTIAVKRIDDFQSEAVILDKSGKGNTTGKAVISKDGKTRTVTTTGTRADGKTVHNVVVYEKQ